jgi:hypothetical protein
LSYVEFSALPKLRMGPSCVGSSGFADSTTSAVTTLVMLAIGRGESSPTMCCTASRPAAPSTPAAPVMLTAAAAARAVPRFAATPGSTTGWMTDTVGATAGVSSVAER